jgi:hypothetical protein
MNQSSDALHPQPPTEWKFAYFASHQAESFIQRLLLFFLVPDLHRGKLQK